jgi:Tripartite tricarboxylate transporter TctB family
MPTDPKAPATAPRRGFVRGPQNFVAGLTLIGIALFAIWAISDLPQGTLRAMGPAMLPRWLAIGVGLCGVALAVIGVVNEGDGLGRSDYSPIAAIGGLLILSAAIAFVVAIAFLDRSQIANAFIYTFLVLFYGTVLVLFVLSFTREEWLTGTGLRGPFFVVAGILAFAITIRMFGLVIAGPLAMVIGGFGTPEVREKEILIFAAVMTAFCVGLFRYLLNLPIPILIIPGVVHI